MPMQPLPPHIQVKLKEIISRLDARCSGGGSGGGGGDGSDREDDGPRGRAAGSGGGSSVRSSRCTVLLSATLHQELGALATAIQKDPIPVGFAVQQVWGVEQV